MLNSLLRRLGIATVGDIDAMERQLHVDLAEGFGEYRANHVSVHSVQAEIVHALKERIEALEDENAELTARIAEIETLLAPGGEDLVKSRLPRQAEHLKR